MQKLKNKEGQKNNICDRMAPFVGVFILFAVWFAVSRLKLVSPYVLPTPERVWGSFLKMLQSGELFVDIAISFGRVLKGFTGCDRQLLEVGDTFGYSKQEKFTKIIFPYASADILVDMRIGMGYSWRAIIGAEMVAASTGLGHMILFSQQMSRADKVIIGILTIGSVGLVTDRIFGVIMKKLFKGAGENGWN